MSDCDNDFTVHDNVFTDKTAFNIINLFVKFQKNRDNASHGYFTRASHISNETNGESSPIQNPIEKLIDNYLTTIGDNSMAVEYWYRATWLDMTCHQDLNEYILSEKSQVINPNNGHIMYLSEMTLEAGTVLFSQEDKHISVVYPKVGRVVRFNGKTFHYVPRPFNYMFGEDDNTKRAKPRFVLLFNTWNRYVNKPSEKRIKTASLGNLQLNDRLVWEKLPLFQTVPLYGDNIEIRIRYMGESMMRFNKAKVERYNVNKRFKTDGYHKRLLRYEIDHIPIIKNITKNDKEVENCIPIDSSV